MSTQALIGSYQPSQVSQEDQLRVEAHRKLMNEKLGWSFLFYRVSAKWTQVVNGENIFYHLVADRHFRCSVNFYKSLQGGINLQVTFGAMGWVGPRSRRFEKGTEGEEENFVVFYYPSKVTEQDNAIVLNEHKVINEALGWECGKYSIAHKWVEGFLGGKNVFYQMVGDDHLNCSVNFLLTSKEIRPRITLATQKWTLPDNLPPTQSIPWSQLTPAWVLSLATEDDQEFIQNSVDTINKRLGWSSKAYKAHLKYTQTFSQLKKNVFYHLTSDQNVDCSVNFNYLNRRATLITFACEGWVQPRSNQAETGVGPVKPWTQNPNESTLTPAWESSQPTEGDQEFIKIQRNQINNHLGWASKQFKVNAKWTQTYSPLRKNVFYHLTSDQDTKCSVNFNYLNKRAILITFVYEGWVQPTSDKAETGVGPAKPWDQNPNESTIEPAWESSQPTEGDREFIKNSRAQINHRFGWESKAYKIHAKWTQTFNPLLSYNVFYHLTSDQDTKCSVNFNYLNRRAILITFAHEGWVQPRNSNQIELKKLAVSNQPLNSDIGRWHPCQPTEEDEVFLKNYLDYINQRLGCSAKLYKAHMKFIMTRTPLQSNKFYHLTTDQDVRCSVNFNSLGLRAILITFACYNWTQPRISLQNENGIGYGPWDPVLPDEVLLSKFRGAINQRLGWSSQSYKAHDKWTQAAGISGSNTFYHLTSDLNLKCSVMFNKVAKRLEVLVFAKKGWVEPNNSQA